MSAIPELVTLQAQQPPPDMSLPLMIATIGLIFYFLVIRPQNKKQRELEASVKAAQKGDQVITTGGLHGRVHAAAENTLTLDIANIKGQPVRVEVERSRIERIVTDADKSDAKGEGKGDGKS